MVIKKIIAKFKFRQYPFFAISPNLIPAKFPAIRYFQSARAFVSELSLKTHRRTHRRTRLRGMLSSAGRLLNFTDVGTWFQMCPDDPESRFNLRAGKFENFSGGACPQTSLVRRVLHVRLPPTNSSLAPPPLVVTESTTLLVITLVSSGKKNCKFSSLAPSSYKMGSLANIQSHVTVGPIH